MDARLFPFMVNEVILVHPLKASVPMEVIVAGITRAPVMPVFCKAEASMEVIVVGMDGNAVMPVQPLKAPGMDVRPAAALRSTEVMPAHPAKAEDPMEVIWAGITRAPVMPVF
jgi:hypothetical protein